MAASAALLFTDVVDSTLITQRLGDVRAAALWAEHDRRARGLLRQHGGREMGRTDGFLLLFEAAADAARYAIEYHAQLTEMGISARAGMHVGPVVLREASDDDVALGAKHIAVEGLALPVAARVMAMARGGQTLLTAAARHALDGAALGADVQIHSHGHYRLKGIDEPVAIFEIGVAPNCSFSPPSDADKSYRVVEDGDLWRPVRDIAHRLPAEPDRFVGRGSDLAAIARQFEAGTRLLTLLGPAGTGKTRLAIRYGRGWLGDLPGGVWFCDLSEASTLDGIHVATASALGVRLGAGDATAQLAEAIAGRGRCLVVFDNFEQVMQHAAATVGRWLDAPDATFMVTSRERLNLPGEVVQLVEPLPLDGPAIELFVARAHAVRHDFAPDDAQRIVIAEIVRLLDGLPLAIELAAARIAVLAPSQLLLRLRDRFKLLTGTQRREPASHATRCNRLVVAAVERMGAGGARAVLGIRWRLHARGGGGGDRSFRMARRAVGHRCDAGTRRQEPAAPLGALRRAAAPRARRAVLRDVHQHPRVRRRKVPRARAPTSSVNCVSGMAGSSPPSVPTKRSRRSTRTAACSVTTPCIASSTT